MLIHVFALLWVFLSNFPQENPFGRKTTCHFMEILVSLRINRGSLPGNIRGGVVQEKAQRNLGGLFQPEVEVHWLFLEIPASPSARDVFTRKYL